MATGSYASLAAEQPLSLTALRFGGVRYWWAGIGTAVLVFLYVGPIAAALRQPAVSGQTTPLANLTMPNVAFPLLRVPKVHRLAPPPALRHAKAGSSHRSRQNVVRHRVPVVTDKYELLGASGIQRTHTPVDLFSSVPTTVDTVGAPVAMPAASSAPAAPSTTPAAPAAPPADAAPNRSSQADGTAMPPAGDAALPRSSASDIPRRLAANDPAVSGSAESTANDPVVSGSTAGVSSGQAVSSPPSLVISSASSGQSSGPASQPPTQIAIVGASAVGSIAAPAVTTTTAISATVGSSSLDVTSPTVVGPISSTALLATQGSTTTTASFAQPGDTAVTQAATGSTAATGSDSCNLAGLAGGATPATQTDGATTASPSADCASPDPMANTASGLAPPAASGSTVLQSEPSAWRIAMSGDAAHAVGVAADGSNIVVTIDGVAGSKPIASVASLFVTTGGGADVFAVDASLATAGLAVTLDGGAGDDTLLGPRADTTWTVSGAGIGSIGAVAFAAFEHLVGAADTNDTFDVGSAGSVSSVDGGAGGYDVLDVSSAGEALVSTVTGTQSGSVARGSSAAIAYSGLEPVSLAGATHVVVTISSAVDESVVIEDDDVAADGRMRVRLSDGETQMINGADRIADLTVNAGSGSNTITVRALDSLFRGSLTVNGGTGADSITLEAKTSDGAYMFDGGDGQNTIVGAPFERNVWSLTGVDSGTLAVGALGAISFSNTQNITEGTAHDAFVFGPNGAVIGTISGTSTVDVSLGDFVSFSGAASFARSTGSFRLSDGTTLTDVPYYTVGLANGTVFAGVNPGASNEAGFGASATPLGAAIVVDSAGGRAWHALSAVGAGDLTGVDEVSVHSGELAVDFNGTAGDGTAVDFGGTPLSVSTTAGAVLLADPAAAASVSARAATVGLFGLLQGSGDVTFRSSDVGADLGSGPEPAHLLTFSVKDATVTLGSSSFGATFIGDLTVAQVTPAAPTGPATDTRQWTALQASGLGGSLTFGTLAGATIVPGTGVVELNVAEGARNPDGVAGSGDETPAAVLDWSTALTGAPVTLTDGTTTISGHLAALMIDGFVTGSGMFQLDVHRVGVHVGTGDLTNALLLALHMTNMQVTVGDPSTGGVGFSSTGGVLDLAALQAPPTATDDRLWIAAEGTISGVAFSGGANISLDPVDLNVTLNVADGTANGTGTAAALDWLHAPDLNRDGRFGDPSVAPAGDRLIVGDTTIDLNQALVSASGIGTLRLLGFAPGTVLFTFEPMTAPVGADRDGTLTTDPVSVPRSRGPPSASPGISTTLGWTIIAPAASTAGPPLSDGRIDFALVDPTGGTVSSADGRALVSFGTGGVTAPTAVTVVPSALAVPPTVRPASAVFSLNATDTASGATITTFAGSPLLTISYDTSGPAPTAIYYIDESGAAVALPSTVDTAAHTITAALTHFSDYVAGTPAAAPAAPTPTVTWVGSTGGDWNTPSMWSTGIVPTATDDVYIGLPAGQTVTISSGSFTVNTLTCDCELTINAAGTLTLASASQINGKLTLAGGTIGGAGDLTVNAPFNVTGSGSTLTGTGTFTTQGTTTINTPSGNGYLALSGGKSWVNQGTLTIGGDERIIFGYTSGNANSLTNAAGASIVLGSTASTPFDFYTGSATITNLGTLSLGLAGSHTIEGNIAFSNGGTVTVTVGILVVGGRGTDSGLYSVAAGAQLTFAGGTRTLDIGSDVTGAGTLAVSGGTVNVSVPLSLAAGTPLLVGGGSLNFNATQSLPSLVLAGGTLGGTGAVTVTGNVNVTVSGSTLTGTGSLTTQGTTTIDTPAGNGYLAVTGGRSWVNQGTLTIGGDERIIFGYTSGGSNTLTNAAGGSLVLSSTYSTPFDFYTGTASVTNLGTLSLGLAGSHTIDGNVAFSNGGTVVVSLGTLVVGGGGTDSGVYSIASGGGLTFAGGTRNLQSGADVTGAGALTVSGGTVNASVLLSLSASGTSLVLGGGTLNFNATQSLPSLVLAGGTLGGTGAVTLTGNVNVTVSGSTLTGTGSFTTQGATTINTPSGNGYLALSGGKSWVNQGTLTIGGDERIIFGYTSGGSNTLTNAAGGSLVLSSTYSTPFDFYTGSASIVNLGALSLGVAGSHTIDASVAFSNGGTVAITAGTLALGGGGTDTGPYSVAAGSQLTFAGGTRTLAAGSDVTGAGTFAVTGGTVTASAPLSLSTSGTSLVLSGGTLLLNTLAQSLPSLVLAGGTLGGTAAVTVAGSVNVTVSGSMLSGTGSFTTLGATTISTPSGNGFLAVNAGKSWVNQGTITVGGDERIFFGYFNGGTNSLTNALGGSIVLASTYSAPLELYTGSASILNLGTITQTATGSHSIDSSIAFTNSGTVTVTAGTLTLGGGGTDSGLYSVAAGSVLGFTGGTRNLEAGSDVAGGGTLSVSGGTVNADAALSIAATGAALTVSGGTLNVNTASVSGLLVPVTASGGALDFNGGCHHPPEPAARGRDARWDGGGDGRRQRQRDGEWQHVERYGVVHDAGCDDDQHAGG